MTKQERTAKVRKQTPKQIERALKKLATRMAAVSYSGYLAGSIESGLWAVYMEAFKVLIKTGADKYYRAEMEVIERAMTRGPR